MFMEEGVYLVEKIIELVDEESDDFSQALKGDIEIEYQKLLASQKEKLFILLGMIKKSII